MTLRRLALPAVLSLGLLPGLAQALGLGEIKLNSHLYEPLDAEIELVSVRDLEAREILPSLAGGAEFKKAGLERFFHLSRMRFEIQDRPGGRKVIKVTTTEVVTEPFLNFLVEVHWPSGRLLREYTMLLDPPAFARATPAPVAPPVVRQPLPPVPAKAEAPKPAPAKPTVRAPVSTASAPTRTAPPVEKKTEAVKKSPEVARPAADLSSADSYGPVKSSDTLWSIAKQHRPSGANMHQTMLAIQRLNPEAFINNNINLLKRGKVLQLPSADQVRELSRSEATEEFARQEDAWKSGQPTRKVSRDTDTTAPAPADESAHLKLVAAPPEDSMTSGSSAGGTDKGTGTSDAALSVAKENLDKSERRAEELSGHVQQLEGQVRTLERLIELKNSQLADLQAKLGAAADTAKQDPAAKAAADMTDTAKPVMEDAQTLEERLAAAQAALDDAGEDLDAAAGDTDSYDDMVADMDAATGNIADADKPAIDLMSEPEPQSASAEDTPAPVAKPKPKPKAAKPKKAAPPPPPEPGLFENPLVLGGLGGGALLALLGGMLFMRRRSAAKDDEEMVALDEGELLNDGNDALLAGLDTDKPEPEAEPEQLAAAVDDALEEPLDVPEPEHKPAVTAIEQALDDDGGPSLDDLGMELTADIAGGSAADAQAEADLSAELDSLSAELDAELDDAGTGLDDLDLDSLPDDGTAESVLDDLELDLDEVPPAAEAAGTVSDLDDELGGLDLESDLEMPEVADDLEAGLDDLDLSSDTVDDLDLSSDVADDLDLDAELGDLGDLESAAPEAAAEEATDEFDFGDLDLDDTAGGDEVATKMDLARAYIDMGDAEGAREILDEVVQEGNDEQKAEAEALISKL